MPSLIRIKINKAFNLPSQSSNDCNNSEDDETLNSSVLIEFGSYEKKTHTCINTCNPIWNESFRIEVVDDSILQDTPLELRVINENYSNGDNYNKDSNGNVDRHDNDYHNKDHNLIGVVFVDLNPLVMRTAHDSSKKLVINGDFPLYDIHHGLRGTLSASVQLQFIDNNNPFRDSSAGVQFFSAS